MEKEGENDEENINKHRAKLTGSRFMIFTIYGSAQHKRCLFGDNAAEGKLFLRKAQWKIQCVELLRKNSEKLCVELLPGAPPLSSSSVEKSSVIRQLLCLTAW